MSDPRVVLVTGSTDGIGRASARALAAGGMTVIVHGRSKPRVDAAVISLQQELPGGTFHGVSFDLGALAAVRKGAEEILERFPALHVLVNNAGIFSTERTLTKDDIELTFAVNHVGPFLLTHLLSARLIESGTADAPARVIDVASVAHTRGRIHLGDLSLANAWTGYAAYAQSKLANVMHAYSLAAQHEPDKLVAYSLHPGVVSTKLLRQGFGPVSGSSTDIGAKTTVMLAGGTDVTSPSGSYYSDGVVAQPSPQALDEDIWKSLWSATEQLAGI